MLRITIPANEIYDEANDMFVGVDECTLELEHNLVAISKWESKWHKAFLTNKEKTTEETIDYIKCMTLTKDVDPAVYNFLTRENVEEINAYIGNPMTATTFSKEQKGKNSNEVITSELVYYWMIALNIPVEFENWHINRLLTLVRVCNIKNQPPKKMSRSELTSRNAALNAARRQQLNTKG